MAGEKRFPKLEDPKLFLASPGDVAYLRHMARRVVYALDGSGGGASTLAMFAWETADTEFEDGTPIQEQIYRPDDPLCRGLVAFFGERIGQPLAADFPTDMLGDLLSVHADGKYRLVRGWHPEAAATGGFPLTGSTFEVLCVVAENRRRQSENRPGIPIFLRFVSPPQVLECERAEDTDWGNRRLRNRVDEKYKNDKKERRRHEDLIDEQLVQLRNFVLFLKHLGLEPRFEPDEAKIEQSFRQWLATNFLLVRNPLTIDPFRGLRSYDVEHYDVYYGRALEQETCLAKVEEIFDAPTCRNVFWVVGASGSGKSSFLRAGLVGALKYSPRSQADYAHAIVRPNALISKARSADSYSLLRGLFAHVLDAFTAASSDAKLASKSNAHLLNSFDSLTPTSRPEWAAHALDTMLESANAGAASARLHRLIVAVDQFEEVVDMLEDADLGPQWEPVIEFLTVLSRRKHALVLLTFREEREEKMRRNGGLAALWDASAAQRCDLSLPSATDLASIVRKPFSEFNRAVLDKALVARIVSNVLAYAKRHTMRSAGSVLPLVSLCLQRINENVVLPLVEARHKGQDATPGEALNTAASDPSPMRRKAGPVVVTIEDAKDHTALEGVIAELALMAMTEARELKVLKDGDTVVDDLLRQLVRWYGKEDKQFSLPSVKPSGDDAEKALARALVKHRLLVDDGADHVHLVHETVLEHWPEARDFCRRERSLHENAGALAMLADMWSRPDPGRSVLEVGLEKYADAAFEVLALWACRLHVYYCPSPDVEDLKLRSYCLDLLHAVCEPERVVESSPTKTTHFHLAAFYGRRDTVAAMLAKMPDAAKLIRADGRNALFAPCFVGDVELVDLLIENGADPDAADEDGWRPIHVATTCDSVDLARRLLQAGADIRKHGRGETSVLHLAAQYGRFELTSFFIDELKLDVEARDEQGNTAVMRAIGSDCAEMVRHLAANGANLALPTAGIEASMQMGALHVAARQGAARSVDALLDLGVSADLALRNGCRALHLAAHNGYAGLIRSLAPRMTDIDARALNYWSISEIERAEAAWARRAPSHAIRENSNWTALHFAAAAGKLEAVDALIESGADPNVRTADGDTPLHLAAENGHDPIAILLSVKLRDIDARNGSGRTPLHLALAGERYPLASDLVRQGASIDAFSHDRGMTDRHQATLLHLCAADADTALLRFVVSQGADSTRTTTRGRTALHIATGTGLRENVQYLLASGDAPHDLFAVDVEGLTPVDTACLAGSVECFDLLASRTDGHALRERCPRALHFAARNGCLPLVGKLLDLGYDPNGLDPEGFTPLHVAVQNGHEQVVTVLLGGGADVRRALAGEPATTAFDLAIEGGHAQVLGLVLERPEAKAVDTIALAFRALDFLQFDCVAALLAHLGKRDIAHPASGAMLSALYVGKLAEMNARFPHATHNSAALDTVLDASTGAQRAPGPTQQPARDGLTQSLKIALAGDLYPEYDVGVERLWSSLSGSRLQSLIDRINPVDGKHALNPETVRGSRRRLPWYDDVDLVQIADPGLADPKLRFYYLTSGDDAARLDGTSRPIHEVNGKAPIRLTEANVADYLRFFCFFVRGKDGPFYVCEHPDDPIIPRNPKIDPIIRATARPVAYRRTDEQGRFRCDGMIFYSNAIFIAEFAIYPTGNLEMVDDEPIAADLPDRIVAPLV